MIKKIEKILFFCLLLIVTGSYAFADGKVPTWVFTPKVEYPQDKYMSNVGSGSDRTSAEVSAIEGLAAIFGQSIQSDTNVSNRMAEAAANGKVAYSTNKEISQDIQKQVKVDNLIGAELRGFWYDNESTWYAIAVIDKEKTGKLYKDMIDSNTKTINTLINGVQDDLYSLPGYCAYDFAQEIAENNQSYLERLSYIDSNLADSIKKTVISPEDLTVQKNKISTKIPIAVLIDGDDGRLASAFLDALKPFGFKGSLDPTSRYLVTGTVNYEQDPASKGRSIRCLYDLEVFLYDTKDDVQIFPINLRGRQSNSTFDRAKDRAEQDLIRHIRSTFAKELGNYVKSYVGL